MGKGLALLGLILIIVGLLPVILLLLNVSLPAITDIFYMLGLIDPINLGGYMFSDIMLILIGLGVVLLIVGAVR
ncbi:MAG: hypothetical protein ACFFE2_15710 [Candidatus Thorarchaeota archaeon]